MDLKKLNSATKYPSILTYHELAERGLLTDECTRFPEEAILTEKIDGCLIADTRISMADGSRKRVAARTG